MGIARIVIHGAAGRMGRRLIALAAEDSELQVVAALEAPGHPRLGDDAGRLAGLDTLGVPLADRLNVEADVVVDFSLPEAFDRILTTCVERKVALVAATTGLNDAQVTRLHAAAETIPILWAPNMSLAVNLVMKLAELAAAALADKDADVEIIERHHRFKEDAPSGTALKFGQIISGVMGQTSHQHGREGRVGRRPHGEIGYHAVRVGDHPGEHTIVFAMPGETVELAVRASNRDCYAAGALAAAKFIAGRKPGLYTISDVLGL